MHVSNLRIAAYVDYIRRDVADDRLVFWCLIFTYFACLKYLHICQWLIGRKLNIIPGYVINIAYINGTKPCRDSEETSTLTVSYKAQLQPVN